MHRFKWLLLSVSLGFAQLSFLLFSSRSMAFVELNAFYFSEAEAAAASTSGSRTFLEGTVGFRIDKAGQYLVGWGIASHSTSSAATTTATYTSLQMGPRFLWMIDKQKSWSVGLAYYIVTTATYDDGSGTAETWKGTSLHADGGYNLPIGDDVYFGIRFNYSASTFTERLIGSTTYSTVSYTKTYMYPSLAVVYIF
ncbi:MAG: hypothetical protein U1E10_04455 [Bdellovibrionales bacterium]|nr:hypothetical protein [Bdellovibrionales bacterium]